MWRSKNISASTSEGKHSFSTTPRNSASDNRQIEFHQMYCFEGQAQDESESLAFLFFLNDYSNNNKEYKAMSRNITHDLLITVCLNYIIIVSMQARGVTKDWSSLKKVAHYTINFSISGDIGSLHVALWQSCEITGTTSMKENLLEGMREITNLISMLTTIFLSSICGVGSFTILIVAYFSRKQYHQSDPINYFAVIWMILELWDFFSDLAWVVYLYFFWIKYERIQLFILFVLGTAFLLIPYCLNLFYYSFLNQLWQQDKAPVSSKLWLSRYSWIFLTIAILTGGVHPALELTNSMLWPRQLFAMHLPYSELIRVRSERFVTNVLTENFPFLLLQISYYFVADSIESRLNEENIIFWGTVASSVLSALFSGTYYFSNKYQLQSAIATYSFSFGFRTDEFEHYWIHSHWYHILLFLFFFLNH